MNLFTFSLPFRAYGEKNRRDKWAAVKRTKEYRRAAFNRTRGVVGHSMVLAELQAWQPPFQSTPRPTGRIIVTLTRLAPHALDKGDNLNLSMSAIRDGIAEALRIDDRDEVYDWKYAQKKTTGKKYAVLVTIEF